MGGKVSFEVFQGGVRLRRGMPRVMKRQMVLVAGPLLVGFLIYFSCRTNRLLYYEWIPFKSALQLDAVHAAANSKCSEILGVSSLSDLIVFSLPAALFAFSLTYYIDQRYLIFGLKALTWKQRLAWRSCFSVVLAAGPELLQWAHIFPGHFDYLDVFTAVFASGVAFMFSWGLQKRTRIS